MPINAISAMEAENALDLILASRELDGGDDSDEDLSDLLLNGCEPFVRVWKKTVGHERLSLERLQRM